jgi:hypothetical protein
MEVAIGMVAEGHATALFAIGQDVTAFRVHVQGSFPTPHPPNLGLNWLFSARCAVDAGANIRKQSDYRQIKANKGFTRFLAFRQGSKEIFTAVLQFP